MENEFSRLVDALPGLVWIALPGGLADFVNRQWRDYTGMSLDEAVGSGWLSAVHPEDREHFLARWEFFQETGKAGDVEARLCRADGLYRLFNFSASPIADPSGSVVKWCGISTDIEDRKQAEAALRAEESRFRLVFDGFPALVTLMSPEGELEHANKRVLNYFDKSFEELKAWDQAGVVHPDDLPAVIAAWADSVSTCEPYDIEQRNRGADGIYRWFQMLGVPLKDPQGNAIGWTVLENDIDDRKRAEDALLASERALKTIINTLPTTAWATDAAGYVEFLSDRWLDYAGFAAEQGAGLGWGDAIHPDDQGPLFSYWQSCLETGTPVDAEARMRRFDGEYRWFLFRANPLRDETGMIMKWYGTNIDIEDRKRADAQLKGEKQLLEMIASGRALGDVLGALCEFVEDLAPDCLCGIYPIDWAGPTFQYGIAPSLPASYIDPIAGWPVREDKAPCGIAVFEKRQVIVVDVETDLIWRGTEYRNHVVAHGLRSVWSTPICSLDGRILGTFCVYQRKPATPSPGEQELISHVAHIASIAFDRAQAETELRRVNSYLEEGQRLTLTGTINADLVADDHQWSEEAYRIFEFDLSEKLTSARMRERLYPDDVQLVMGVIQGCPQSGTFDFECRLRMPAGRVKYIHIVGRRVDQGPGQRVLLACIQDITERRLAEQELQRVNSYLEEAQRLSLTASFAWDILADEHFWSREMFRTFGYEPTSKVTTQMVMQRVHLDDVADVQTAMAAAADGGNFDIEYRLMMPDGAVKHIHGVGHPMQPAADRPMVIGCLRDITERKLAEKELRQVNGYLEEAQRLSLTGSFTWDVRAEEHYWSAETFRIFELEPVDKVRLPAILSRLHPDDVAIAESVIGGAASGANFETELRLLMPNGSVKHVDVLGRRVKEITDRSVFLGCIRDITQRKLAEEELRRSQAFLVEGQRLSATGSFSWRLDTDQVLFSDELNRIFEFGQDAVVTLDQIAARVHPEDLQLLSKQMETARGGIEDHRYEIRLQMPNGAIKHVYVVGHRFPHIEDCPVFIGSVRDITASKRAEQELRRINGHLADAHRLAKTGSISFDYVTDTHLWSDETYRILEVELGSRVTGMTVASLVHPDDMPIFIAFQQESVGPQNLTFRVVMADGRVKWLNAVAEVTKRTDGLPAGTVSIQDVTELRHASESLEEVRSELAHVARVSSLGVLTASIAHEVNQPLSGIITNASTCLRMLAADPPNVEGARETAKRTIRDGNRAAEVITRLRGLFARKSVAAEAVDLNEATQEVIALSAGELQRNRVVLKPDLTVGLPPVVGDRVQLQQVILNLVLNAADAMADVSDRPRQLTLRTQVEAKDRVRLTATDNGTGFGGQDPERLFDAFHTTKSGGMGIGLSVSRSIIESHGGRLWAEANKGPGATFSFSIPRGPEAATNIPDRGGVREPAPQPVLRNV